jgi:DNA-binding SARP family transcriptional activator
MGTLNGTLFRILSVEYDGQVLSLLNSQKVRQLLAYMLLDPARAHSRERLAEALWSDKSTAQARKALRQTLWQLQSACEADPPILLVQNDYMQLNPDLDIHTDVAVLERAYAQVCGLRGSEISDEDARTLQQAVRLYNGELLEGWYDDWCLAPRERLETYYLTILSKLVAYHEVRQEYEVGLLYARRILEKDVTHEETHRRVMRLLYLAGDRIGAIRQYERCAESLREELDVEPSQQTHRLHTLICADRLTMAASEQAAPAELLDQIQSLQAQLISIRTHVQQFKDPNYGML